MKEQPSFEFDPEAAAQRVELVGHLKIDPKSKESIELLTIWATVGESLVEAGTLSVFEWNKEEAQIYLEAEHVEAAIYVLKCGLIQAIQEGEETEVEEFRSFLSKLGADPDDLDDMFSA